MTSQSHLESFSPFEAITQGTAQAKLKWGYLYHSPTENLGTASPCVNGKHRREGKGAN